MAKTKQASLFSRGSAAVAAHKRKKPRARSKKKTVAVRRYSRSWPPVRKKRKK